MLSHLRILQYSTYTFLFILLLAGCGTQNKKGLSSGWSESYRNNKEHIAQQREIRSRMRKELPSTNIKDLDYEHLVAARKYYDDLGYPERALKCYERMLALSKDPIQLNNIRLEMADRLFETGDFHKASKLYLNFLQFYPGSDKREYVEYKAILSHFYITLSSDRDQTETKTTLALTQLFLEHASIYKEYVQDVKDIQKQCYEKLVGSEMNICAFHLRHANTKGAEQRLAYINEHLRRHVPALEPEILALETNVNTLLGKPLPDMQGLNDDSVILADITEKSNKRSMADRF